VLIVRAGGFNVPVSRNLPGHLFGLALGNLEQIFRLVHYIHVPPRLFLKDVARADVSPATRESIEHVVTRGLYAPEQP
jgi:hypothetical protein